jgi:outer membrane protein assembly factor BamB
VPLEVGDDGTIYVTTRDGYLDVLEADGRLRYSVTLGGIASGPIYVDGRGSVFIATLAGTVLGFDARGRKVFVYKPPIDIERGLTFGDGVGLLVRGRHRVVLGVNRVGVPVYRFEAPAELSTEPLGFFGFCVVATKNGKLYFGNRALQRKPLTFTAPIAAMQTTSSGMLWVRTKDEFVALRSNLSVAYRRSNIERFYAFRKRETNAAEEGFLVDDDGVANRVLADGMSVGTVTLREDPATNSVEILASDGEGGLFATDREGTLLRFSPGGPPARLDLRERPVGARLGPMPGRLLVGTSNGGIYAVRWGSSAR